MPNGYLLKFNNLYFVFSSSEVADMDDFIDMLDGHLMENRDILQAIVIKPLFTHERKVYND